MRSGGSIRSHGGRSFARHPEEVEQLLSLPDLFHDSHQCRRRIRGLHEATESDRSPNSWGLGYSRVASATGLSGLVETADRCWYGNPLVTGNKIGMAGHPRKKNWIAVSESFIPRSD